MSAITSDGKLIHYEVLGRGRPVILVHGWIGSWRYWIPTMQHLQLKYRVYALDLYGFGDSAKDPKYYALEQQIALLNEFMEDLGIPKAALIGHGLGALVATEFSRRYPDRVPRLLIADAPLYDPGDLDRRIPAGRLRQTGMLPPLPDDLNPSASPATSASAAMRAAMLASARARSGATSPSTTNPNSTSTTSTTGATSPPPAAEPTVATTPAPAPTTPAPIHNHNPLIQLMEGSTPEALLARCFRRNEPSYEKLSVDLAKIDAPVLRKSVESFNAGRMLDTLRLLTAPVVVVHGVDDPLIPQPSEEILTYITLDKEHLLLPILLPNVRHFPMLEDDRFARLTNDFLEAPDISKLEIKERWRRRTR